MDIIIYMYTIMYQAYGDYFHSVCYFYIHVIGLLKENQTKK